MENINAVQTPDTSELACGCVIINACGCVIMPPHHAFYAEWVSLGGAKTECDCAKREAIEEEGC